METITLENIVLWDAALTPAYAKKIIIDLASYNSLSENDKWIIVGKWKIKVVVQPAASGLALQSHVPSVAPLMLSGMAGSIFVDQSYFQIAPSSSETSPLAGSVSGCFDFRWG